MESRIRSTKKAAQPKPHKPGSGVYDSLRKNRKNTSAQKTVKAVKGTKSGVIKLKKATYGTIHEIPGKAKPPPNTEAGNP